MNPDQLDTMIRQTPSGELRSPHAPLPLRLALALIGASAVGALGYKGYQHFKAPEGPVAEPEPPKLASFELIPEDLRRAPKSSREEGRAFAMRFYSIPDKVAELL